MGDKIKIRSEKKNGPNMGDTAEIPAFKNSGRNAINPEMRKTTAMSEKEIMEALNKKVEESPKESVERLKKGQAEIAAVEVPPGKTPPVTHHMMESEALILENLQLKEQLLRTRLHGLEVEMTGLIERIRGRLQLAPEAEIRFGKNNTISVTG